MKTFEQHVNETKSALKAVGSFKDTVVILSKESIGPWTREVLTHALRSLGCAVSDSSEEYSFKFKSSLPDSNRTATLLQQIDMLQELPNNNRTFWFSRITNRLKEHNMGRLVPFVLEAKHVNKPCENSWKVTMENMKINISASMSLVELITMARMLGLN